MSCSTAITDSDARKCGPASQPAACQLACARRIGSSPRSVTATRSPWYGRERQVLVDAWFSRETEHPLADDVALDLVGAAGDRHAGHAEGDVGEQPAVRCVGASQLTAGAEEVEREVAVGAHEPDGGELAQRDLGP